MEEETAFPDLSDFEFVLVIYQDSWDKLRLPDKFVEVLDGREHRKLKLREAGGGSRRLWDAEVVFDGHGHMYLGRGWDRFAREHDVHQGHFIVFSYDGDEVLTVKVFDGTMCRRHYHYYQHDDDDSSATPVLRSSQLLVTVKEEECSICSGSQSGRKNSIDDTSGENSIDDTGGKNIIDTGGKNIIDTGGKNIIDSGGKNSSSSTEMDKDDARMSQFTVMLKQCHLGEKQQQYLNVPADFHLAHGYDKRSKVVLRMRGRSWPVTVKHNVRAGGRTRATLRYGWHQFCVDNGLGVGDTCFFRGLRGSDGEDHQLKVEVRRRDGTFFED